MNIKIIIACHKNVKSLLTRSTSPFMSEQKAKNP